MQLFISDTPKKLYLVHWLYWLMAVVGVIMVLLAHGHYTVDIIVAYFITTRLFWLYHTLANNASLKVSKDLLMIFFVFWSIAGHLN